MVVAKNPTQIGDRLYSWVSPKHREAVYLAHRMLHTLEKNLHAYTQDTKDGARAWQDTVHWLVECIRVSHLPFIYLQPETKEHIIATVADDLVRHSVAMRVEEADMPSHHHASKAEDKPLHTAHILLFPKHLKDDAVWEPIRRRLMGFHTHQDVLSTLWAIDVMRKIRRFLPLSWHRIMFGNARMMYRHKMHDTIKRLIILLIPPHAARKSWLTDSIVRAHCVQALSLEMRRCLRYHRSYLGHTTLQQIFLANQQGILHATYRTILHSEVLPELLMQHIQHSLTHRIQTRQQNMTNSLLTYHFTSRFADSYQAIYQNPSISNILYYLLDNACIVIAKLYSNGKIASTTPFISMHQRALLLLAKEVTMRFRTHAVDPEHWSTAQRHYCLVLLSNGLLEYGAAGLWHFGSRSWMALTPLYLPQAIDKLEQQWTAMLRLPLFVWHHYAAETLVTWNPLFISTYHGKPSLMGRMRSWFQDARTPQPLTYSYTAEVRQLMHCLSQALQACASCAGEESVLHRWQSSEEARYQLSEQCHMVLTCLFGSRITPTALRRCILQERPGEHTAHPALDACLYHESTACTAPLVTPEHPATWQEIQRMMCALNRLGVADDERG